MDDQESNMTRDELREMADQLTKTAKYLRSTALAVEGVNDPLVDLAELIAQWAVDNRIGPIGQFMKNLDRQVLVALIESGMRGQDIARLYAINHDNARQLIHSRGLTLSGKPATPIKPRRRRSHG